MNKHLLRSLSETGRLLLGNRKAGRESEKETGRKGKGENKGREEGKTFFALEDTQTLVWKMGS